MADKKYDFVVVGAGPGGYVSAIRAAQNGLKTAIIEKDNLGGVCLNWGCIPSKVLLYAAELLDNIKRADHYGIELDCEPKWNTEKLRKKKDEVVKQLTGGVKILLEKNKVDIIRGVARFESANSLSVTDEDKNKGIINFESAVVATGASPISIPGVEIDRENIITSKEALEVDKIPDKFGIIGGSFIGCEMADVYHALGSQVTIIEMLPSLMFNADEEISSTIGRAFKKKKIELKLSTKVKEAKITDGGVELTVENRNKEEEKLKFDKVLAAIGMKPNSNNLGLEKAGVEYDEKGWIKVNNRTQTSVENIYAIGDVVGGALLAHKASHEGLVAADVAAGKPSAADFEHVPYAVFTDPEISSVGLTEQQCKDQGIKYKVGKFPYRALGKAIGMEKIDGFVKVIAEEESDDLLGMHIIGPHASDLIGEAVAVMEFRGASEDIASLIHIHPTLTEAIGEAAMNVFNKAIHIIN
ncbi:MAG: dihydrolipoyl dehydrogenase [candidate division Zixibacteria bacterium]|nr:dihydrolipoyl dehydrogenase [candidate division Zixibacteria bacterium]